MHNVSDGVTRMKAQMDHKENVPDPSDEDHENVPNTAGAEDSEDYSCMVVHGDEEWIREYEKMSVSIVWSGGEDATEPADEDPSQHETSPTGNTRTGDLGVNGIDGNTTACDMGDDRSHIDDPVTGVDQPGVEEVVKTAIARSAQYPSDVGEQIPPLTYLQQL